MNYIKTTEKVAVENYPYGYTNKTTAYFSVEYTKGRGFRSVFQTVNPKTGILNKEKKSTYAPVIVLTNTDGKIGTHHLDFYGDEGLVRDIKFLSENFNLFTKEQIEYITFHIIAILKANLRAKVVYTNSDQTKLFPLFEPILTKMVEIARTGENLFGEVEYDIPAIKALEQVGFNPFKVTSTGIN